MTEAVSQPISRIPLLPTNETERLAALRRYKILDTPPETAFDRITALAARLFDVPIVLIALMDETRAWFKSCHGFNQQEVPRGDSICNVALFYDDVLVVPDTQQDDRFVNHPYVQGAPGIRFYASAPLLDQDGFKLGVICLVDTQPRASLTNEQKATLTDLAAIVVDELELRLAVAMQMAAEQERQQAHVDQQETLQRLHLYADVVRNAQVGIVVWHLEDLDDPGSFRLVIANAAAAEATGFEFESVIGKTMAESFPKLLQTSLVQQYLEVVRTGRSLDLGEVPYSDDGISTGFYSLKAFPLPGNCLGLAFENVTVRKQLETQLQEIQHYTQQIAEAVPGVLFVHDVIQQQNIYTNRQITELLGYTSEQVKAMGESAIATLIHPDDLERVFAYFAAFNTAPDGAVLGIEYRAHHAHGNWRWFYTQSVVFNRTAAGLPQQVLGVSIDISDRKLSEQALQESEAWTRLAAKVAQLGGWRLHLETNLVELDERMCQIWGESNDAVMIPLPQVLERIHPDDRERVAHAVNAALDPVSQGTYEVEYRIIWNNGTERWVSTRGQTRFEGDGTSRRPVDFFGTAVDITDHMRDEAERKQAEVALVKQEQRYRYIFEAVNIAIWEEDFSQVKVAIEQLKAAGIKDFSQYFGEHPEFVRQMANLVQIQDVNQAALQMFKAQDKSELLASLHQIFVPETTEAFMGELLAIANNERLFAAETIVKTLQGDRLNIWFSITFPPTTDSYDHVLVSLLDITQRKQSEAKRERSEAILNAFMAASPIALTLFDRDLRFIYANEALAQLNGLPLSEHQGRTLAEVVPAMAPQFAPMLQQIIATQEPVLDLEYCGETRPGIYRHTIANHFPVCLPDGEVLGVGVTVTDVSEIKRVEAELRQHSERLNLLYETTSDLLSAKQPLDLMNHLFSQLSTQLELHYYYHFQLCNQEGQETLRLVNYGGLTEVQAQSFHTIELGQAMCGLVAQERRQIVLNQAEIAIHPNAATICLMGVSAYAGQPLIVNGRLLGTLSFASFSRTQFTSAEADLLQAISEQVAIALDRAELVASLQQQTEDLAQANRIKDEFLAVLSHELRSPLNPILGWTKLLQTGKFDPPTTQQALEIIERNAKQQTQLIDDLLDLSKILRGKLTLNETSVDLSLTIAVALETVRLAAEAKNIQIIAHFDSSLPPVLGDAGRLQQIVMNLLSNAIKFTPNNGQVTVRLTRTIGHHPAVRHEGFAALTIPSPNAPYAQITVSDNGKGIHPDFLPYVFESFRQEDGKTTRKFGGLGLGLAIVRQLTELHGGTVHAASNGDGKGATFTVRLPLMQTPNTSGDGPSGTTPSVDDMDMNTLPGVRILVVDDEADMRDFIVTVLQQTGAIARAVASATEALAVLDQFQPMLLISDIGMPDIDGYELMRQVKRDWADRGQSIPAIALTAYAMEQDQRQAFAAGFKRHLAKPIEPAVLIKEIVTLLQADQA